MVSLPIGLIFLIQMLAYRKGQWLEWTLLFAIFAGFLIDVLLLRPIGLTALIFLGVAFLLKLYQRKLETVKLLYIIPFTTIIVGFYSQFFYQEWLTSVFVALAIIILVKLTTGFANFCLLTKR